MITYLQNRSYYEKIYDQQTIDECLRMEDIYKSKENSKNKKQKVYAKTAKSLMVAMKKYDRAGHRNEVITKWMKQDEDRDNHLVSVPVPQACCCNCDSSNLQELSRDFMKRGSENEKVLFMFVCDICSKRQAYWEDGLLWRHEPKCIECKKSVNMNSEVKDNILVSTYECLHCGYKDHDDMDLVVTDNNKKQKENEKKFEELRTKYCLSEYEGEEYLRSFESLEELTKDIQDRENQKNIYDAVAKMKRLTVVDLEKNIKKITKLNKYAKLQFSVPEIGRNVVVPFILQDKKKDRHEYDSRIELTKILKKELEKTNWRLMSEGITYRIGILQGRLRGYENEDDLIGLLKRETK